MLKLEKWWYQKKAVLWPLIPVSFLFSLLVKIRRKLYQYGILPKKRFPVPVIVVGNLTVGGTGKTPLVIYIAEFLKENGFKPGIISSGYKGKHKGPVSVYKDSDPKMVGDEALVLARYLSCPIFVARNRKNALKKLLQMNNKVDVVISDDGLQHYALARNIEIAVIDGQRRFGNGYCLPAGPLREPQERLKGVHLVVNNGGVLKENEYEMEYLPCPLYNAVYTMHKQPLEYFKGQVVHAVAGVGNPTRFFQMLVSHGLQIIPHVFPDHYKFKPKDIYFGDNHSVIMTEKDAVKCLPFADIRHWVLPIKASVTPLFDMKLLDLLKGSYHG